MNTLAASIALSVAISANTDFRQLAFNAGSESGIRIEHIESAQKYKRDERNNTMKYIIGWAASMLAIYVAGSHSQSKQRATEPANATGAACMSDFPVLSNNGC